MHPIIKIITGVLTGVKDAIPVVSSIQDNIKSELGGAGKVNLIRLVSSITASLGLAGLTIWLTVKVAKGEIEFETYKSIINIIDKVF